MTQERKPFFNRHDLWVGIGFALVSAAAHLIWNPIIQYWQFVVTTVFFTGVVAFWLAKEWKRLELVITKFYCVAVVFDILAEGLLQPFHHCTMDNLLCTGRMFLVFFAFWMVLHPIERRFFPRKPAVPAQ